MKTLFVIPALLLAVNASAQCTVGKPRDLPRMPDGATATAAEMVAAQRATQAYVDQAAAYVECGVMNRLQHNRLVSRMELLAESYDEELIEFQQEHDTVADR